MVRRVKLEVRPLFLPHLMRLAGLLAPGLHSISWTNPAWRSFSSGALEAIRAFDVLVTRYDLSYSGCTSPGDYV